MSDKNTPSCDFRYPEEETALDVLDRECAKRGWKTLKLLDLVKMVLRIKIQNPQAPISKQKITYRGFSTHCGTKHCREE